MGRLAQWWQTRDQGDSLTVARRLADIVGIDFYPRYALTSVGAQTLYLDGAASPWQRRQRRQWLAWARQSRQSLMVSEGQAEPWETVTVPPSPPGHAMASCPPEQLIHNYNAWLGSSEEVPPSTPTYFGEPSTGCSDSSPETRVICRHLLGSSPKRDRTIIGRPFFGCRVGIGSGTTGQPVTSSNRKR